MSQWSSGNFDQPEGGMPLPAPVVRTGPATIVEYQIADGVVSNPLTAPMNVVVQNPASVSVHGLPAAIMGDLPYWQPKLELMRYVGQRRSSSGGAWGRNYSHTGYVHPSHGPGASGNGSHTHGGVHGSTVAAIQAIRPTEWDVTNWGQVIDVTQGMTGFFKWQNIRWRDATGALQVIDLPCPTATATGRLFGTRYPYQPQFRPGYYRFRWSVLDPSDTFLADRRQRITGPLSDTISITTDKFPWKPEPSIEIVNITTTASLVPGFVATNMRCWIGSVSRLPR